MIPYNKSIHYTGQYRGIHWKIANWSFSGKEPFDKWNYYLNFRLNQFDDQALAKKLWPKDKTTSWGSIPDYYRCPIIHDIEFHGGVTFFQKHENDGFGRRIEVGCDYSHLWDEGRKYYVEDLLRDVKSSIDAFHEQVKYKIKCSWAKDVYVEESEGEYMADGSFYSFIGRQKSLEESK